MSRRLQYNFDLSTPRAGPIRHLPYPHSKVYFARLNIVGTYVKNEILIANRFIFIPLGVSMIPSETQWHLEVENFHNTTMSGFQATKIYHITESKFTTKPGLNLLDHIHEETDRDSLERCRNQRLEVTRYTSFVVLGILIIVVVSAVTILTDIYTPCPIA